MSAIAGPAPVRDHGSASHIDNDDRSGHDRAMVLQIPRVLSFRSHGLWVLGLGRQPLPQHSQAYRDGHSHGVDPGRRCAWRARRRDSVPGIGAEPPGPPPQAGGGACLSPGATAFLLRAGSLRPWPAPPACRDGSPQKPVHRCQGNVFKAFRSSRNTASSWFLR